MSFSLRATGGGARYVKNSSDYISLGIDRHDIDIVVQNAAKSLLESAFTKNINGKKTLAISDLSNLTDDDIDVEFLSRKLTRALRKNENLTLTNALSGSGASIDNFILSSRNLKKNKNFNQRTTQEDGTLIAPDYSLSGKIVQRNKSIGDNIRIDYDFLFILTDLKTGRVVWDNEEHISKIVKKAQAKNFKKLGKGTCDLDDVIDCNRLANEAFDLKDYKKSYILFKKACKLGDNQSCDIAEYVKTKHKEPNKVNSKWRLGFIFGGDIGIGTANANMVPIPYAYGNFSQKDGLIHLGNEALQKLSGSGGDIYLTIPMMLKAGLFLQYNQGLYLNANILYGGYNFTAADSQFDFQCNTSLANQLGNCAFEGIDLDGLKFQHRLLGWNLRVGYGFYDTKTDGGAAFFIGGGALKDYGSKMIGTGAFIIDKELNNTYPFWEAGIMISVNILFIEASYRYMFDGKPNENFASIASFNLGTGLFLPMW